MQKKHSSKSVSLPAQDAIKGEKEKIHILHVEDDEVDAILAQRAIYKYIAEEAQGYEIEIDFVTSLNKALSEVKKKPYTLILLDLLLDDAQGPGTITTLKSQVPDIPIIVLTGRCDVNTAFESIEDGAADYIMKQQMGAPAFINAVKNALKLRDKTSIS